jgi:hypothetical protein
MPARAGKEGPMNARTGGEDAARPLQACFEERLADQWKERQAAERNPLSPHRYCVSRAVVTAC